MAPDGITHTHTEGERENVEWKLFYRLSLSLSLSLPPFHVRVCLVQGPERKWQSFSFFGPLFPYTPPHPIHSIAKSLGPSVFPWYSSFTSSWLTYVLLPPHLSVKHKDSVSIPQVTCTQYIYARILPGTFQANSYHNFRPPEGKSTIFPILVLCPTPLSSYH